MKQMTKEELIEYFIEQLGDNEVLGQFMTIEQIREKLRNINLKDNRNTYGKHTSAALIYFSKITDNETKVIYEIENKDENLSGIFGNNYRPYEATLDFSYKNIIDYTVTIETWDYSSSYKINRNNLKEDFVIQLPNTTAHYTFNVTFKDNNDQLCEAVFVFNIGDID